MDEEEKSELQRRRRAAELEGREVVSPVDGWGGERAELDAWRRGGRCGGLRLGSAVWDGVG